MGRLIATGHLFKATHTNELLVESHDFTNSTSSKTILVPVQEEEIAQKTPQQSFFYIF